MTRRFKRKVKGFVRDGEITEKEREILNKIIQKEKIDEIEAEAYITIKRKERRARIKDGPWIKRNAVLITSGTSLCVAVITGYVQLNK